MSTLLKMTEPQLRTDVLVPLLSKTAGVIQVTDVHGTNEKGLDIIFFTADAIRRTCYGMQIKTGHIAGGGSSRKTVTTIVDQLELAGNFKHPVHTPPVGKYSIDRFIVATNGRISQNAREEIVSRQRPTVVEFWDQNEVIRRITDCYPELLSGAELPTVDYLRAVKAKCETLDALDQVSGVAPRKLSEVFVEPKLRRRIDPTVASRGDVIISSRPTGALGLIVEEDNVVILGEQNEGKTAILRMAVINAADRLLSSRVEDSDRIPVTFRASAIVSSGSVTSAAIRALEKSSGKVLASEVAHTQAPQRFHMLIDGFSELPSEAEKTTCAKLIEEFAEIDGAKVTVAGRLNDFLHTGFFDAFHHYTIEPFGASDVRVLVGRWTEGSGSIQDVAEKLVTRIREALQLPGSPIPAIIGVMLYEREQRFITNTAEAVDRYMVIRLGRYAAEMGQSTIVPWHRKQDLLAEIAFVMVEEGIDQISEQRALAIMNHQYKFWGETSESGVVIEELVDAGVLYRQHEQLSFHRTAFRDFFAAHRVVGQTKITEEFFESHLFDRRWGQVLVFAAGLRRKNTDILERLVQRVIQESEQSDVSDTEDYIYAAYVLGRILSNSDGSSETARLSVLQTCVQAFKLSAFELAKEAQEQFGNIGQISALIGTEHTFFVTIGVPWLAKQLETLSGNDNLSEEERYLLTSVHSNLGADNWMEVLQSAINRVWSPRVLVALILLAYTLENERPPKSRRERDMWKKIKTTLKRKQKQLKEPVKRLLEIKNPILQIEQKRLARLNRKPE